MGDARAAAKSSQAQAADARPPAPAKAEPPSPLAAGNQQVLRALGVQAKLSVSQPDDPDEQEADRLADAFVSRKCASCEQDEELRRKTDRDAAVPSSALLPLSTSGAPLPDPLRRDYEGFFGTDLSQVRLHQGTEADRSARSVNARAYTLGRDIVFAAGEFSSHGERGRRLLAHELTHVTQQRGAPPRIAREVQPNPVLNPDEMFQIIVRERAWTFSPGGGAVCEDPAGVGRGVGPAAGGRMAGHSVFAVIQVTDANGRPVALSYGEHVSYTDLHAEQRVVAGLHRQIPAIRDISGGRMTVVLDQVPCPPGRSDCMGLLQRFARERGLQLEIHLPTRESVRGTGQVAPRTAAMSSQRTDVPRVSLNRYYPQGAPPAGGGGTSGAALPAPGGAGASPTIRFVPPRPASPSMLRAQASLIARLQAQTQRSVRLTARITLVARGVGALFSVLSMISTLHTMQRMAVHGTLFPEAEEQADSVGEYGAEMQQWTEETTDEISLLGAIAAVSDADQRNDSDALFDLDSSFTDLYMQLSEHADRFNDWATDLRARERALDVMSDFYEALVSVPQGASTAPNAEALAMHISLQRLSGRVGSAAGHFEEAQSLLRFYADYLQDLAGQANDRAWAIIWERVGVAMAEYDRERALEESLRRERRLNEIHVELENIDAELNQPICRPAAEVEYLTQRRELLMQERALLGSATPSP